MLVSATNLTAGRESSGFLFGLGGSEENNENPLKDKFFLKNSQNSNLALAPLAQAKMASDPESIDLEKEEDESAMPQGQALVAGTSMARKDPQEDGGLIIYTVRDGDTISSIASNHKITINTILWANNIDDIDSIMPEDKIFILPVSGLSYTVKEGDTIEKIADEYKAEKDKIIAFNDMPANGEIEKGQEIIIPGGEKEIPVVTQPQQPLGIAARPYESFESAGKILSGKAGTGHSFPYGYCTWYVAQKRYVPWGGNAGTWLYRAKASGYSTGSKPKVGSIMVSSESWWGHVALVEKVSGSTITISEMNYKGWAKKSSRTIDARNRVIKGFIY
jgi:surface antigen